MPTKNQTGDISELRFAGEAIRLGYAVAQPWSNTHPYDWLISRDEVNWLRVQVKTASRVYQQRNGRTYEYTRASIKRNRLSGKTRKYKRGDFDLLAIVDSYKVYLIPFDFIRGLTNINTSSSKYDAFRIDNKDLIADGTQKLRLAA